VGKEYSNDRNRKSAPLRKLHAILGEINHSGHFLAILTQHFLYTFVKIERIYSTACMCILGKRRYLYFVNGNKRKHNVGIQLTISQLYEDLMTNSNRIIKI
jgi:hypothetical protein